MFDTRLQKSVVKSSKDGSCCDLPGTSAAASAFDDDMVDRFDDEDAKDVPPPGLSGVLPRLRSSR